MKIISQFVLLFATLIFMLSPHNKNGKDTTPYFLLSDKSQKIFQYANTYNSECGSIINKCFKLLFEYIKEEIMVQESQPKPKDCNKRKTS